MTDWFRSWHGAPTDPKLQLVAKKAKVQPSIAISLWWCLLDIASQADPRGNVESLDPETLALVIGCDEKDVEKTVKAMREKGMISPDNTLKAWNKRQPRREDETANERKRRQRERDRKKDNGKDVTSHNVTHCHDRVEESREEEKESEPIKQGRDTFSARAREDRRAEQDNSDLENECDAMAEQARRLADWMRKKLGRENDPSLANNAPVFKMLSIGFPEEKIRNYVNGWCDDHRKDGRFDTVRTLGFFEKGVREWVQDEEKPAEQKPAEDSYFRKAFALSVDRQDHEMSDKLHKIFKGGDTEKMERFGKAYWIDPYGKETREMILASA